MTNPLTLDAAARALNKSLGTLRRWAREGAPIDDLDALAVWFLRKYYSASYADACHDRDLERLAGILLDFLKREEGGDGARPAHQVLDVSERKAAAYLALLWRYVAIRTTGTEPEDDALPPAIQALRRIAVMDDRVS